jgi:serine/threonine protein kinase
MSGDRWNRIEEIFHAALERPLPERDAYLVHACGDDRTLRSEVESLLANDGDGGTTLDLLVGNDLKDLARASSQSDSGLQIGPYRLVRELDSGGMGVVHLAVRSDDHYFQVVAIKTIRKGLASPDLVRRFRAERQILATLTHPNIGAILDGGDTDDGRPYIVMEYVEGQPITIAAENRSLSVRQRIELFRSVCSAVHYAHQKLVIHRDIKPSNVLVTPEGVVKLIDFGVSKPLAPELIPGELPKTESWQRFMTPDYASPEQMQGRELTTATDVYSLGVLLFELLTDSRPYTLYGLSPAAAERLVCEVENPKPSSIQELAERTRKEVAGDLDRIVLMAMDKDPARRYLSARHLEEDLLRFLENKPIFARKPSSLYRLSKFVQRHRTSMMMACATLVVLIGSILFHQWQSRAADRKLQQVASLADSAITDMTGKLQASSASVETRAAIFRSSLQYLSQLRQSSGDDPRLLLELSKAYMRVGDLEGSPYVANLGDSSSAVSSYQEALRTATEARAQLHSDESTTAVIEAYQRLGMMEFWLDRLQDAAQHFSECLALTRDFWRQKHQEAARTRLLALTYLGLGDVESDIREPDKAFASYRTAVEVIGPDLSGSEEHDQMLARFNARIGRTLNELGSQTEALQYLRKSIAIDEAEAQKASSSNQAQRTLFALYHTIVGPLSGEELLNVGSFDEGRTYAHKALSIAEALAASDKENAQARADLAFAYWGLGNALRLREPKDASGLYRRSIALTREIRPLSEAERFIATRNEALAAVLGKDHSVERLRLLEEANAIRRKEVATHPGLPDYRLSLMRSYCKLADAELAVNEVAKAR